MNDTGFRKMIEAFAKAYITVYGIEKWNSLTAQEQHDAAMIAFKDLSKALNA